MDSEKIFEKLNELALGQQRMEMKLDNHLNDHKLSFKRLTQVYIPTFGILLPVISFALSWFHANYNKTH